MKKNSPIPFLSCCNLRRSYMFIQMLNNLQAFYGDRFDNTD